MLGSTLLRGVTRKASMLQPLVNAKLCHCSHSARGETHPYLDVWWLEHVPCLHRHALAEALNMRYTADDEACHCLSFSRNDYEAQNSLLVSK